MVGRASALAVLGLGPGADTAAIEQAYRRLIKQYHPDREGGDGVRAAEIIHAYRELRGGRAMVDPLQFHDDLWSRNPPRRRSWPLLAAVLILAAFVGGIVLRPDLLPQMPQAAGAMRLHHATKGGDPIEEPLHDAAIGAAVRQARILYTTKDEIALTAASRDCQQRFRNGPGIELLDRCAAFDNAVVGLRDRDPLRDGGPFTPLAVTGRQWSAASSLSDDYVAIDSRLDRIRLAVELTLAADQAPAEPSEVSAAPIQAKPTPVPSHWPKYRHPAASGRKRSYRTRATI